MAQKTFYYNLFNHELAVKKGLSLYNYKSYLRNFYKEKGLFIERAYPKNDLVTTIIDTNSEIYASTDFIVRDQKINLKTGTLLDTTFFILKHKQFKQLKIKVPKYSAKKEKLEITVLKRQKDALQFLTKKVYNRNSNKMEIKSIPRRATILNTTYRGWNVACYGLQGFLSNTEYIKALKAQIKDSPKDKKMINLAPIQLNLRLRLDHLGPMGGAKLLDLPFKFDNIEFVFDERVTEMSISHESSKKLEDKPKRLVWKQKKPFKSWQKKSQWKAKIEHRSTILDFKKGIEKVSKGDKEPLRRLKHLQEKLKHLQEKLEQHKKKN